MSPRGAVMSVEELEAFRSQGFTTIFLPPDQYTAITAQEVSHDLKAALKSGGNISDFVVEELRGEAQGQDHGQDGPGDGGGG